MAINKKFIHFNKKISFETELKNNNILDTSICFIKDSHEIYTHGQIYACIPSGGTIGQVLAWESDGKAKWEDVSNLISGFEDVLAYGVEINITSSDPHLTRIGNKAFHQSLPIQSQMRGCIAQGGKVMYWLNKKDWRFREEPTTIQATITVDTQFSIYTMTSTTGEFADNRYVGSYIKIKRSGQDDIITQIVGVASNKALLHQATMAATTITSGTYTIELGSVLNGYDGTVRVYVPEFYIKSDSASASTYRVWLSTNNIDSSWTYQPAVLVDAYRCTVLNTVPTGMGYLSTLPINSAISVVNTNSYCRGAMNRSANDKYQTTNPCQSDLCKPISNLKLETMRTNAARANANLMSYEQYKNIFYWLYVVEYANLNCQEAFNDALTNNGYHQGGLGTGVTNVDSSMLLNWGVAPITPCGYGNDLGNGTGVKDMSLTYNSSTITYSVPRWRGFDNPFGEFWTCLDGALSVVESGKRYIYTCSDTSKYSNTLNSSYIKRDEIITSAGYIKQFTLGTKADIIPKAVGGSPTTYMCDLNTTNTTTTPTILIVGGSPLQGQAAGLSTLVTNTQDNNSMCFRTISTYTES